jgi:PAS domain S-box-containing protein
MRAPAHLPERPLPAAESYAMPEPAPDPALARIASLAARLCNAPVALVSRVDSETHRLCAWHGLPTPDRPAGLMFCAEVLLTDQTLATTDARTNAHLAHHPLVATRGVRACLALPLRADGDAPAIGTLCILDVSVRDWSTQELASADDLAAAAAALLAARHEPALTDKGSTAADHLEFAFRHAPIALAHLGPDGAIVKANRALCELLGEDPGALADALLWEYVDGPDRQRAHDCALGLQGKRHDRALIAVQMRRRNGSSFPVELSLTWERTGASSGYLLAGVVLSSAAPSGDAGFGRSQEMFEHAVRLRTNELNTANELLRGQNRTLRDAASRATTASANLRLLTDSLPALIAHWDDTLTLRYVNAAQAEYSGLTTQEMIGKSLADVVGPELYESILPRAEAVLAGIPQQFERRLSMPGGEERTINFHCVPEWSDGAVTGFFAMGVNITHLRRSSDALARREALLRATSEVAGVAGWEYDLSTNQFWYSEIVRSIVDAPANAPVPTTDLRDYFPPYVRIEIETAFREAVENHRRFSLELPLITVRRRPKWVRMVGEPQIAEGRCSSIVGALQDITAERTSSQSLRAATAAAKRANNVKDLFLANMSHEIRTPLNGVIGMTGLLLDTELSGEQREYVEIARSSGETLLSLVNDILDLAKIESDQLELERIDFSLRTIIDEAIDSVALAAAQKGIDLNTRLGDGCDAAFRGDPTRLRQVLINLLGNAVKFTETGGVTLEVAKAPFEEGRLGLDIAFKDTGIGIPPDKLEKLFAPFTQADAATARRHGGTGLGLSICKRIVEGMRGLIAVESEVGVGTTFRVRVELEPPSAPAPAPVPRRKERALVVAADTQQGAAVVADLEYFGIVATLAEDAVTAVSAWRTSVTGGEPYSFCFIHGDSEAGELIAALSTDGSAPAPQIYKLCSLSSLVSTEPAHARIRYLQMPLRRHALQRALHVALGASPASVTQGTSGLSLVGRRVLLAEDNPVNVKLETRLLERLGMHVVWAANGLEALERLAEERFDVVLMDCQMPEMDGYEATRLLRRGERGVLDSDVPVVALTAHALASDRERCYAAGMDDYVTKPIDPRRLASVIDQLLEGSAAVGGTPAAAPVVESGVMPGPAAVTEAGPAVLAALPLIDCERLNDVTGDDAEFRTELLEAYVASATELVDTLKVAMSLDDDAASRRAAHQLKGASLNVGAMAIAALAARIEESGLHGNSAESLSAAWDTTNAEVARLMAG